MGERLTRQTARRAALDANLGIGGTAGTGESTP